MRAPSDQLVHEDQTRSNIFLRVSRSRRRHCVAVDEREMDMYRPGRLAKAGPLSFGHPAPPRSLRIFISCLRPTRSSPFTLADDTQPLEAQEGGSEVLRLPAASIVIPSAVQRKR